MRVMKPEHEWCLGEDGHNNIAALLRHMRDADGVNVDTCIEVVERPWRWTPEWEAFQASVRAVSPEMPAISPFECAHISTDRNGLCCDCGWSPAAVERLK